MSRKDFAKPLTKLKFFVINRYPLIKHIDDDIFRPYRTPDKNFGKDAINYMNLVDVYYENSDNIFDKETSNK